METAKNQLKAAMDQNSERVEHALRQFFSEDDPDLRVIEEAQQYSLLGGGKRIRPFLVNEFCRVLGGSEEASMPFACAVEMIHTYSLIHDDLPCMDDDDMRRGKPTNHKKFGYANALLAGDALLTRAFGVATTGDATTAEQKMWAVRLLAQAAGDHGMIGGQVMDLAGEQKKLDLETLKKLHALKTGALICVSALLGCLAAGYLPDSAEAQAASAYADGVGIAFQIIDDIMDVSGDPGLLGKNVGSDADHHKTTFMTYYDEESARAYAAQQTSEAISAIAGQEHSERLTDLAVYLLERNY